MKRIILGLLLFAGSLGCLWAERYALVIGNSDYRNIQSLNTPENDAADIAAALSTLGYRVDLRVNVGIDEMEAAVFDYTELLARSADNEGFFWYAGHGVQADNENFLLPVDIDAQTISQVKRASYSLSDLMQELEYARNRVNVIILDACRNNPLPAETRSLTRGLAVTPVVQDTFVMFSTAAGATADDGGPGARNSPFTEAFLRHIASPEGLDDVAKEISRETIALTNSNQRPYISDNILYVRNYSLNPTAAAVVIPAPSSAGNSGGGVPSGTASAAASSAGSASLPGTAQLDTGPRQSVQDYRPAALPRAPATFILDDSSAFSLSVMYENSIGFGDPQQGAFAHGGLFHYSFLEIYKTWGELFIAPNAYFFNLGFHFNRYAEEAGGLYYVDFTPSLGVMWKMRPDAAQRMLVGAGLSVGVVMLSRDHSSDGEALAEPVFRSSVDVGVHASFAFRFTPLVALEFNAGFHYPQGGQAALGVGILLPYGSVN